MQQYIARRLLLFIPSLIGVTIIIFALMRVVPGDVAVAILAGEGGQGIIDPEQLAELREELGLNNPLYVQYWDWISDIARGDFGKSLWTKKPVLEEIGRRLPLTIELAILTMLFSSILAVAVGLLSAIRQDTWIDYIVRIVSIGGLAMPVFWTGILVIFFLILLFNWMPPLGYASPWDNPWKNVQQMIFPAFVQGYYLNGIVARMTRSCTLEVLREDYIRTAWAKGLKERTIIIRHALKNSILPVATISGTQFGVLLGGTIIMETVFSLPGMGRNLIESVYHRDYPMIQTIVLFMSLIFLSVNLLVDLLYGWLDPRIRYQ